MPMPYRSPNLLSSSTCCHMKTETNSLTTWLSYVGYICLVAITLSISLWLKPDIRSAL